MKTRREFFLQATAASAVAPALAALAQAARRRTAPHPGGEPIRLAIVGTGQIADRYLSGAAVSHRARFVATCARTLASAQARAVEYGIEAWFDDYEKMYDTVAPDAVVIATPNAVHFAPAMAAFERGIHVLCEKPMASTWEECQAMVAAAERHRVVFLCMPYNHEPEFLAAANLLNEATLGVFVGAEAQSFLPGVSLDNFHYRREQGGGATLNTLVYEVSVLIDLLGPARRVTGFVNTLIPHRILGEGENVDEVPPPRTARAGKLAEPTADDNVTLVAEWAGGQQAVLRALWGTSFSGGDTAIYGRHGALWLADGIIVHSPERAIPGATPVTWHGYSDCYRLLPVRDARPAVKRSLKDTVKEMGRTEGLIEHFVDCIRGGPPTCSGRQRLHIHEILFKGLEAARTGQAQTLATAFTPWHSIDPMFLDTRSRPI